MNRHENELLNAQNAESVRFQEALKKLKKSLLLNFGLLSAGVIITVLSYNSTSAGGSYFIFWGLILFGGVKFLIDFYWYLNPKKYYKKIYSVELVYDHKLSVVSQTIKYSFVGFISLLLLSVALSTFIREAPEADTDNTSATETLPLANTSPLPELQSGDVFSEINARRASQGTKQLEYSAVAQNVAQNLAYFNYQNPSVPVSATVLSEAYGGQDFSPSRSAFNAINDMSCTTTATAAVDRMYESEKNNVNSYLYTEAGIYIGKNDVGLCNIWVALDRP